MEFVTKLLLSFIVGGGFVSGTVWVAGKLSAKIGAAIAGMPTTILVSLAFIHITGNAAATKSAISIIPMMLIAALLYSLLYVHTLEQVKGRYKYFAAGSIALLAWVVSGVIIRLVFSSTMFVLVFGMSAIGFVVFQLLVNSFQVVEPKAITTTGKVLLIRFLVAGSVVSLAVLLARILGPTWGGLIGSFPATIASSLYFLGKEQGSKFSKGFVRNLPISFASTLIFVAVLYAALAQLHSILSFSLAMTCALIYTSFVLTARQNGKPQR